MGNSEIVQNRAESCNSMALQIDCVFSELHYGILLFSGDCLGELGLEPRTSGV